MISKLNTTSSLLCLRCTLSLYCLQLEYVSLCMSLDMNTFQREIASAQPLLFNLLSFSIHTFFIGGVAVGSITCNIHEFLSFSSGVLCLLIVESIICSKWRREYAMLTHTVCQASDEATAFKQVTGRIFKWWMIHLALSSTLCHKCCQGVVFAFFVVCLSPFAIYFKLTSSTKKENLLYLSKVSNKHFEYFIFLVLLFWCLYLVRHSLD